MLKDIITAIDIYGADYRLYAESDSKAVKPLIYANIYGCVIVGKSMYPDLPAEDAYRKVTDVSGGLSYVSQESRGVGDTIAKITHATGLDKLSEIYTRITGKPCGCADRQEALNKLFPYGIKESANG